MYLHNMICQRCKDINWLLGGGQEAKSTGNVWRILCTKQDMIHEDGGVWYFSCTYYIMHSLSYTMKNSWVHKGVDDAVSNYYIELEGPQNRHIRHGVIKIGNLVIEVVVAAVVFILHGDKIFLLVVVVVCGQIEYDS